MSRHMSPPWLHSPGITLAGKCRLRDGRIVQVIPYGRLNSPEVYRLKDGAITWDMEGNNYAGIRALDIVENMENTTVKE